MDQHSLFPDTTHRCGLFGGTNRLLLLRESYNKKKYANKVKTSSQEKRTTRENETSSTRSKRLKGMREKAKLDRKN